MIRDPSDGSVKEKPKMPVSGLAPAQTPEQLAEVARLQRSREWLAKYRTNPETIARQNGEQGA